MAKKAVRRYFSKKPGLRMSIPEKDQDKYVALLGGKYSIHFPQANPFFETDEPELQKLIESDKQFQIGAIIRVQTPEDRKALELERKQVDYLKQQAENINSGLFALVDLKVDQLRNIAEKGGAPTETPEGKALPKSMLIDELEQALQQVVAAGNGKATKQRKEAETPAGVDA